MFGEGCLVWVFFIAFFFITDNWIKPEKESKSTAFLNYTRLCPTAKINALFQKDKTALTYWADILEISKIIWVSAEEAESQTWHEQHSPRFRHPTMQDMGAIILPSLTALGCLVRQKYTYSWEGLFQLVSSLPKAYEQRALLLSRNSQDSEPKLRTSESQLEPQMKMKWPEAADSASHSCHVAPANILSNQLWKNTYKKVHSSFLITVQLILNLPVTKEIFHLRKQHSINLTTEQTIPSHCYAC